MLRVPARVSGMNLYGGSVQSGEMIIVILLDSLLGTVDPKSVSETMYLVVAQLRLDPAGKELPRGSRCRSYLPCACHCIGHAER